MSSLDDLEREAFKRDTAGKVRFAVAQLLMAGNEYIITGNDSHRRDDGQLQARVEEIQADLPGRNKPGLGSNLPFHRFAGGDSESSLATWPRASHPGFSLKKIRLN